MYGVGSVSCVSLCNNFINVSGDSFRDTMLSSTYCWSLVRLTYLFGCGWKQLVL